MSESKQLGVKTGDFIILSSDKPLAGFPKGTIGKVLKASDNRLAQRMKQATGQHFGGAWVLVEVEGGHRLLLGDGMFEKLDLRGVPQLPFEELVQAARFVAEEGSIDFLRVVLTSIEDVRFVEVTDNPDFRGEMQDALRDGFLALGLLGW